MRTVSKLTDQLPNLLDFLRVFLQVLEAPGDIPSLCAHVLEALAGTCQGRGTVLYVPQHLLSHRSKAPSALGRPPDRGGKRNRVCGKLVYRGCTLSNVRRLVLDQ
jgi:hypothetical protein